MRIAVTGGRDYTDRAAVFRALDAAVAGHLDGQGMAAGVHLHLGDAKGADQLAEDWAVTNWCPYTVHRADWTRHGKAAGPIRNRAMLAEADVLIAFPGGRGTADCVRQARRLGLPVVLVAA